MSSRRWRGTSRRIAPEVRAGTAFLVTLKGSFRGSSSAGRASRSQCEGREFDPPLLHQEFSRRRSGRLLFSAYGSDLKVRFDAAPPNVKLRSPWYRLIAGVDRPAVEDVRDNAGGLAEMKLEGHAVGPGRMRHAQQIRRRERGNGRLWSIRASGFLASISDGGG